jgi:predicted transposase YbfD/YdcC
MGNKILFSNKEIRNFVDLLATELPDHRDNRGKRHSLMLVIVGVVLATLLGRHNLSSIHRFICQRLEWLCQLTKTKIGRPISRAHLPRLIDKLSWVSINKLIEQCFGLKIQDDKIQRWIAIDGKALRGTLKAGEKQNIVLAITHDTRELIGQAQQCGDKSSEIPVVRELLRESGLGSQKISLDAHHFNPTTTTQIHQDNGIYLIQAKANQAIFLQQCKTLCVNSIPLAKIVEHDKAHGRVTTRSAQLFSLEPLTLDSRWKESGLSVLIVIERESFDIAKQKQTVETSYYVSNSILEASGKKALVQELAKAVRLHWGVESNHWIRDCTFNEDHIKTKAGNQAQVMALLRGLAIELIRKSSPKNFRATIERFMDSVHSLESMLRQVNFL